MLQWGTQYSVTFDRDGKAQSLVQTYNVSLSGHVRGAAGLGPVGVWTNQAVIGARWITNKTLDLNDPEDLAAAKRLWSEGPLNPIGARLQLDDYFERGGGTMAKVTYDSHEPIEHVSVGLPVVALDFESDSEDADANRAEYYVPGKGWVKWDKCGAH
jgi:hypothetical protein